MKFLFFVQVHIGSGHTFVPVILFLQSLIHHLQMFIFCFQFFKLKVYIFNSLLVNLLFQLSILCFFLQLFFILTKFSYHFVFVISIMSITIHSAIYDSLLGWLICFWKRL